MGKGRAKASSRSSCTVVTSSLALTNAASQCCFMFQVDFNQYCHYSLLCKHSVLGTRLPQSTKKEKVSVQCCSFTMSSWHQTRNSARMEAGPWDWKVVQGTKYLDQFKPPWNQLLAACSFQKITWGIVTRQSIQTDWQHSYKNLMIIYWTWITFSTEIWKVSRQKKPCPWRAIQYEYW